MRSNGVGSAAIALFEDLKDKGESVSVFCMRHDNDYESASHIYRFPFDLPYSLENLILSFWACWTAFRFENVHSFENLVPKCNFFHLHFDMSIKKIDLDDFSLRNISRMIASKFTKSGLKLAIRNGSRIVVPSKLLASSLSHQYSDSTLNIVVLPNRLNILDELLIEQIGTQIFLGPTNRVALIANGDFIYKGLNRTHEIFEIIPEGFFLVVIGGNRYPTIEFQFQERVIWLPHMDRFRLFQEYFEFSGILIVSPFESFSMVALEAISCGVPVLLLGEAGIREFYSDFQKNKLYPNILFTKQTMSQWKSCLSKRHQTQLEFNKYLSNFRERVLDELESSVSP